MHDKKINFPHFHDSFTMISSWINSHSYINSTMLVTTLLITSFLYKALSWDAKITCSQVSSLVVLQWTFGQVFIFRLWGYRLYAFVLRCVVCWAWSSGIRTYTVWPQATNRRDWGGRHWLLIHANCRRNKDNTGSVRRWFSDDYLCLFLYLEDRTDGAKEFNFFLTKVWMCKILPQLPCPCSAFCWCQNSVLLCRPPGDIGMLCLVLPSRGTRCKEYLSQRCPLVKVLTTSHLFPEET